MAAGWKFFLTYNSETIQVKEPVGWDKVKFQALRLPSYGLDQPFSNELTFAQLKACKFIKAAYDAEFINADIGLTITSNVFVNGTPYSFEGYLNLAIYQEENVCDTHGWKITVGVLEDNFRERFLSRQDVEIDLLNTQDLDQNTIPALTLRSIRTHTQELYLQARGATLATVFEIFVNQNAVYPLYWENSDFKGSFGSTINPGGFTASTTNVIFQNNTDFTRLITIDELRMVFQIENINLPGSQTATITAQIVIYDETHTPDSVLILESHTLDPGDVQNYNISATYPITLPAGWSFQVIIVLDANTRWSLFVDPEDGNFIRISEVNSAAFASNTSGLLIEDYLRRVIYMLTGDSDGLRSDCFSESGDGCYWNNLLTTGLYIRNAELIQTEPVLKNSFKKIFESLSRIFCLGWEFELENGQYKIRIEPVEYFLDSGATLATFDKIGDIRQYALADKLVNNIIHGYTDKWKNIAVSGIFAIHTDRFYFTPNKARNDNSSVKLDLRAEVIAEGYTIEFLRRLQFLRDDSGSSDRPNDDDTFIIWLNRYEETIAYIEDSGYEFPEETGPMTFDPGTISYGSNFIAESNSPIDRIYNVFHTPVRVAARWWKINGMHTYGLAADKAKLFFQVGTYYVGYSSRITTDSEPCIEIQSDEAIVESADIEPAILIEPEYLLKPIGLDFEVPQSLCDFQAMVNGGSGLIEASSGSATFYGFIWDSENSPVDPKSGKTRFTLYLANQLPEGRAYSSAYSSAYG